jgi:hypothetical protein
VIVNVKGEPVAPGTFQVLPDDDPDIPIVKALQLLKLPPLARRSLDLPDGFVRIVVGPRP